VVWASILSERVRGALVIGELVTIREAICQRGRSTALAPVQQVSSIGEKN
jgi:hypothetical protein